MTDLIFSNPTGATGSVELQVGTADPMQRLLVLRLENFRDLDFHFVTPITVPAGSTLKLVSSCTPPPSGATQECQPSVFYSGYIQPAPSP